MIITRQIQEPPPVDNRTVNLNKCKFVSAFSSSDSCPSCDYPVSTGASFFNIKVVKFFVIILKLMLKVLKHSLNI